MMVIRQFFVVALVLAACKGKGDGVKPAPVGPGSGSGSAAAAKDPWVTADASTVPETPEQRKARADAALARVAAIMPKLAKVRELSFEHDIPREYQTADAFKAFVHAEIQKDLPKAKADDESAALFHIGLLTKPGNLAELEEQAFTTQAGAYYDPAQKKFFVVMVPESDMMLDTMSAHELTHGLQDQHFDLQKFMPSGDKLDDDHQAARRFVAEGDATFTMFLYMAAPIPGTVPEGIIKLLRGQLETFANMSPEEMIKQNAAAFGNSIDPDIKKSVDAMGDIPMTVLVPMVDSYMQGALMCMTAYANGKWKAVDALYTNPPESTEQALHPETKMYPERDHPKVVDFKLPSDKPEPEVANVVLGELQYQIYFQLWNNAKKAVASEGWGGDRTKVVKSGGHLVARTATVWDTANDAKEFTDAYVESLKTRFPKGSGDPATTAGFDRGDGAGKIYLKAEGTKVFIVDGATYPKSIDELIAATKIS
jgi:hypothetical protein